MYSHTLLVCQVQHSNWGQGCAFIKWSNLRRGPAWKLLLWTDHVLCHSQRGCMAVSLLCGGEGYLSWLPEDRSFFFFLSLGSSVISQICWVLRKVVLLMARLLWLELPWHFELSPISVTFLKWTYQGLSLVWLISPVPLVILQLWLVAWRWQLRYTIEQYRKKS